MKLNWIFLGGGGAKQKAFCGGEYGYFLELQNGNRDKKPFFPVSIEFLETLLCTEVNTF